MTQPARRQPFVLSLLLSAMLLSGQALAGVSDQDILQDPVSYTHLTLPTIYSV